MDMRMALMASALCPLSNKEDRVQTLDNTATIELIEASPQVLSLRTAQSEQLPEHGITR